MEVFPQEPSPDVPAEKRMGGICHRRDATAGRRDEIAKVGKEARFVNVGDDLRHSGAPRCCPLFWLPPSHDRFF
jgi:hypothetical protein